MAMLENKVAVVTGASAGIGAATAFEFAKEGAKVVLAARRLDKCAALAETIKGKGGHAIAVEMDVTRLEDHEKLVDTALSAWGKLDIAFNNAGSGHNFSLMHESDLAEWHRVLDVNLTSIVLAFKTQIPAMLRSGGGSIINTSSVGGLAVMPGAGMYSATKHGVIGLTKTAALEFAKQNIRVNALCPGGTNTEMFEDWLSTPDAAERAIARVPFGRFADPLEQARAAAFLAGDAASFVTGIALPVDGGVLVA